VAEEAAEERDRHVRPQNKGGEPGDEAARSFGARTEAQDRKSGRCEEGHLEELEEEGDRTVQPEVQNQGLAEDQVSADPPHLGDESQFGAEGAADRVVEGTVAGYGADI
jgi:hypothetical protein